MELQIKKKFQEGSSVIEAEQFFKNLLCYGKMGFPVRRHKSKQSKKNNPSLKTIHNYLRNCPKFYDPHPTLLAEVINE